MAKKLKLMDTVLRDGHQSILATRMRYEQMEPVLGLLDEIGMELLYVGAVLLMIAAFVS